MQSVLATDDDALVPPSVEVDAGTVGIFEATMDFTCPRCGSHFFGRDTAETDGGEIVVLDTVRCHGDGCRWRGVWNDPLEEKARRPVCVPGASPAALDVGVRLAELSQLLKPGWYNGQGRAIDSNGLTWLMLAIEGHYDHDLRLPFLYPTPEGMVRAEWSLDDFDISLEIDVEKKIGEWHVLELATDDDHSETILLSDDGNWKTVSDKLRRFGATQ